MEENATIMAEEVGGATFGHKEMEELRRLRAENKKHRISGRVSTLGNNKVIWRQRMALRRIDQKTIVPDEDLVAYSLIHKLKNPTGDSNAKTYVSDNEIAAYKELDPDFSVTTVTLAALSDKLEEMKRTGKVSAAGDNSGEGEEGAD